MTLHLLSTTGGVPSLQLAASLGWKSKSYPHLIDRLGLFTVDELQTLDPVGSFVWDAVEAWRRYDWLALPPTDLDERPV